MSEQEPKPLDSDSAAFASGSSSDSATAVEEITKPQPVPPKRRSGCFWRLLKAIGVLFVLLAIFIYWNFLRWPELKISRETTYITEPLTADGTRVDYLAAYEREFYPPEMKTDDNGYRLVVRALGPGVLQLASDLTEVEKAAVYAQICEKLGLDATAPPTMTCEEGDDFLYRYAETAGLDQKQADELSRRTYRPWTLDELPMMKEWLEQNGPFLDLLHEATQKPMYVIPCVSVAGQKALFNEVDSRHLNMQRLFSRALQKRAQHRVATGDFDGAVQDVLTCKRIGRLLQRDGVIVAHLIGLALEGMANGVGIAANRECQPNAEQLKQFVDQLIRFPPFIGLEKKLLAERYYVLDLIQAVAWGDGQVAEAIGELANAPLAAQAASIVSFDWNIVLREFNAFFDAMPVSEPQLTSRTILPSDLLLASRSRRLGQVWTHLCLPSVQAAREGGRRLHCSDNLCRISLAMLRYVCDHGTLPPAYTVDAAGRPLQSWRVLLLPYLGQEDLFNKIHLDEPWDSPHNRQFHNVAPAMYQCPSAELATGQTAYSVIVGEHTPFGAGEGRAIDKFGMHMVLVVERQKAIGWMQPDSELTEAVASKGINSKEPGFDGVGSRHPSISNVALRDGSARQYANNTDLSHWQRLLDGTAPSNDD